MTDTNVTFSDANAPTNPDCEDPTDTPTADPRREESTPTKSKATTDSSPAEDYVYVGMPDGSTRAIPRSEIQAAQKRDADTLAAGVRVANAEPEQEFYLHLANGEVRRVKESEIPPAAGTNAVNGYFEEDNKVHHVVGVYPVETETESNR